MSKRHDPIRVRELWDPAFAELHGGLRDAQRQGPSAEQRSRIRVALGLPATPAAVPDQAIEPSQGARPQKRLLGEARSVLLKLVLSGALMTTAAFGGHRLLSSTLPAQTLAATPPTVRPAGPASLPSGAGAELPGPQPASAGEQSDDDNPTPRPKLSRRRKAGGSPIAQRPPPSAMPAPTDPAGELALLNRARADARAAPARALTLVAQHQERYVPAAFAEEREVIAVEALLAAGLVEQANLRAARFFAQFPLSAHTRRIRTLLNAGSGTKAVSPPHALE
jgi:hypothetical protein